MMPSVKLLTISFAAVLLVGVMPTHAANQEYVGGYFTDAQATAMKAFLENDFSGTSPSSIPAGSWLSSLVNIMGQSRTGNCPCYYQTGYIIDNTGNVAIAAQYWGAQATSCLYCSQINNVGTASSIDLDEEINYVASASAIQSVGFVYNTHTQVDQNSPTIYSFSQIYTGDVTNPFYYGTTSACGATLERYQPGVESPNIGTGTWYVNQRVAEVYASGWVYQPANSAEGNDAYYDCFNGYLYYVGGLAMTGVNLNTASSGTDSPSWMYTGTTIGDGVPLWTGSGGTTPFPCQVAGRC